MTRASPQTDRVIALIEALRAHPERAITLAQVTRQLGTNKSTCHAMLTSLVGAGWLLRDPVSKTYHLGPALVAVGQVASASLPALDLAQGAMAELSEGLRLHCAALAVGEDVFTVVGQVNHLMAPGPRYRIGAAYPLKPPLGVAAVAWRSPAKIEFWLAQAPAERREHFGAVVEATRGRRYSVQLAPVAGTEVRRLMLRVSEGRFPPAHDLPLSARVVLERIAAEMAEEEEQFVANIDCAAHYSVVSIQTPVFDGDGRVVMVLSLTGFAANLTGSEVETIGRAAAAAAHVVSDALTEARH